MNAVKTKPRTTLRSDLRMRNLFLQPKNELYVVQPKEIDITHLTQAYDNPTKLAGFSQSIQNSQDRIIEQNQYLSKYGSLIHTEDLLEVGG